MFHFGMFFVKMNLHSVLTPGGSFQKLRLDRQMHPLLLLLFFVISCCDVIRIEKKKSFFYFLLATSCLGVSDTHRMHLSVLAAGAGWPAAVGDGGGVGWGRQGMKFPLHVAESCKAGRR